MSADRRRRRRPEWEWLALSATAWTGVPYAVFLTAVEEDNAA